MLPSSRKLEHTEHTSLLALTGERPEQDQELSLVLSGL